MITQTKTTWWELISKVLYTPIFQKDKFRVGELPEGQKDVAINQAFLDDFVLDARNGMRWNEEAAMHWAEILTFPFSKMIITFDLGLLAFIAAMRDSFYYQSILILSISFALASLLLLSFFIRKVIVKNINSLAERVRILRYTAVMVPKAIQNANDAASTVGLMKKQGLSLRTNLDELEQHARIWMPWQRIGVYFFYTSVFSTLLGVLIEL